MCSARGLCDYCTAWACTPRTPATRSEPTQQQQTRIFKVRSTQYAKSNLERSEAVLLYCLDVPARRQRKAGSGAEGGGGGGGLLIRGHLSCDSERLTDTVCK